MRRAILWSSTTCCSVQCFLLLVSLSTWHATICFYSRCCSFCRKWEKWKTYRIRIGCVASLEFLLEQKHVQCWIISWLKRRKLVDDWQGLIRIVSCKTTECKIRLLTLKKSMENQVSMRNCNKDPIQIFFCQSSPFLQTNLYFEIDTITPSNLFILRAGLQIFLYNFPFKYHLKHLASYN